MHFLRIATWAVVMTAIVVACNPAASSAAPLMYTGVNIAGGDFGPVAPDKKAVYGQDYVYPTLSEIEYFQAKGFNLIRMPVFWERLQPKASEPLDPVELARISVPIHEATSRHMIVLLDVHNYDRYYGQLVGGSDIKTSDLVDFWSRLAAAFKRNHKVWFGLMNEPHDMRTEDWADQANAVIAGIRNAGAGNFVLVSGNGWDGAMHWYATWYGTPNADILSRIVDPDKNFGFEAHAYFDHNNEGKDDTVDHPEVGADRMKVLVDWCRQHHVHAFLGEFGTGGTADDAVATENLMKYMEANADVMLGYAYWAAGSKWDPNYVLSLEPQDGKDRPQMGFLAQHVHGSARVPSDPPKIDNRLSATGKDVGTSPGG